MTHNLGIDVEALADGDDLLGYLWANVDFHAVTHIEYLIHLLPVGLRAVVDSLEEWRYWEHVVLHYLAVLAYEVQNLGLGTTCAVNHTVNLWAKLIQNLLDYWSIGTGRREYQLTGIDR